MRGQGTIWPNGAGPMIVRGALFGYSLDSAQYPAAVVVYIHKINAFCANVSLSNALGSQILTTNNFIFLDQLVTNLEQLQSPNVATMTTADVYQQAQDSVRVARTLCSTLNNPENRVIIANLMTITGNILSRTPILESERVVSPSVPRPRARAGSLPQHFQYPVSDADFWDSETCSLCCKARKEEDVSECTVCKKLFCKHHYLGEHYRRSHRPY